MESLLTDLAVLTREGRPVGSDAVHAAEAHVARELGAAGLAVRRQAVGPDHNVWACRGAPERLFLAHLDSVAADVPGAVDNAAGVAVLLEAARRGTPEGVCWIFPAAEEAGLVGSRALKLDGRLVVSLDLVGHGTLSVTGLGPHWDDAGVAWLAREVDADQPYAYRVASRLLPGNERSDHAPFAGPGVRSLHLLGRGPGGVYWPYHTPADTPDRVEPAALAATLAAVRALAEAPLPPAGPPSPAFAAGAYAVPGWLVHGGLLGAVLGITRRVSLRVLGYSLAAGVAGAVAWELARVGRPAGGALATPVCVAAGLAWLLVSPRIPEGTPTARLLFGLCGAGLGLVEPLLGLPFAVATALLALPGWYAGAACLVPAVYLLRPDATRELAFHHLLPSGGAFRFPVVIALLAPPAAWWMARPFHVPRWLLAVALGATIATSWVLEPWSTRWPERKELRVAAPR